MNNPRKTLLKIARDKELPHPNQIDKFDMKPWLDAYEFHHDGDHSERGFLQGIHWLNEHFKTIQRTREQFTFSRATTLSANELINVHLAASNHSFYQISLEQIKRIEDNPDVSMEHHILRKSSLTHGNIEADPNGLIMDRLDSICAPLWELFKKKDRLDELFPKERPHQLDKLTFFVNETNLSQTFHNFSRIWQDMLYGGTDFFANHKGVVLASTTKHLHLIKATSNYRRDHHNTFNGMQIVRDLKLFKPLIELKLSNQLFLQLDPDSNQLNSTSWLTLSENIRSSLLYQHISPYYMIDEHLRPILSSLPTLSNDTFLRDTLTIWLQLTGLAAQIRELDTSKPHPATWDDLTALCRTFNLSNLITELGHCTGLSKETITSILGMLTYNARSKQEDLWSQPLIIIDENVCFPTAALLTASMGRNFDIWLNKTDTNAKRRGKLFEKDIINILKECADSNPIISEHLDWTPSIKFKYKPKHIEDIDLTFRLGNIIIIVETRSRRTPITPLDYNNDMFDSNGLKHKTEQARRNAQRVREHLGLFLETYYPKLPANDSYTVVPLVIINGQFHAGYPYDDVPILDPHLLKHFLKDAMLMFHGRVEDGSHKYSIPLYTSIEGAEKAFVEYLKEPLLIKFLNEQMKQNQVKVDIFGKDFVPIYSTNFQIEEPPLDSDTRLLQKLANGKLQTHF